MVRPSPFHVLAFVICLTALWDSPANAAGVLVPRDGSAPIQLQSHRVTVTIDDGLARTTVRQTFINPHRRALEAIYVFPVPEQAALVDLVMEAGGQRLEGLLAERRAARSAYDAIVRKGKDPALLEQIGRSTFRLSVFPVLPDQETMVELTWIEVVPLQAGEYRYVYPLALAGSLTSTERDLTLDVTVRSSAPMVSISSPSSAMATALVSPHEARASFERSRATLDQDLTVVAKVRAQEPSLGVRVFKNSGGDAFFAAVVTPPDLTPDRMLPRDVTLALDVSGSMEGAKLAQARSAAIQMITDLRETDQANVILFNSFLRRFREAPVPMTAENRRDALRFVADATATGGTALGDVIEAIRQAPTTRGRPSIAVVLTDGLPSVGQTDPGEIVRAARVAGNRSMQVWTFGVGHDVDAALLDGVAAATGARCEVFRDNEEIEPRLRAFSARTASPAIADLTLTVGGRVVDGALPHPLPVAYLGEQVVITGRVPGAGVTELCLTGILEGREFVLKAPADLGPVELKEPFGDPAARDLYARAQLDYLARAHRLRLGLSDEAFFASLDRGNYSTSDELVSAQIDVSLETGVQSPYTSFIALLPEDRCRLDPRDVSALDQALLRVNERRRELAENVRDPALASDETSPVEDLAGLEAEEVEEEVEEELVESLDDPDVTDLEVAEDRFHTRRDQLLSEAPFDGVGLNDVLGVGGRSGGKYGSRGTGKGGGRASQKAVGWSLDWMPRHQGEDGSWSVAQVREQCAAKHPDVEPCSDLGAGRHDVGVTAISILSYLGSGNTVSTGKYKAIVRKGLKYLKDIQDPTCGRFGNELGQGLSDGSLYDHAVATVAMTEGYGLSKWPVLKGPAQRATDFLTAAIADDVAWSSTADPTTHLDLWTAAWATMALASARDFGLRVPDEVIEKLGARIADDPAGSQTTPARGVSRETARTAVALLYRALLKLEGASMDPFTEAAVAILMKQQPDRADHPDAIDYHYECFASYAMYQVGGDTWDTWQAAMLNAIVKAQNSEGPHKGTWEPSVDPWGDAGGRIYASAINALSLEVYYRYDRFVGAR